MQPFLSTKYINNENIDKISKSTKNKLANFEKGKMLGQIKISQQATCSNDDEMMSTFDEKISFN